MTTGLREEADGVITEVGGDRAEGLTGDTGKSDMGGMKVATGEAAIVITRGGIAKRAGEDGGEGGNRSAADTGPWTDSRAVCLEDKLRAKARA